MTSTTILLCRHAHPANPDRIFYGHLPGFGLSPLGRRQARGLGAFAAQFPIERIYASPLQRAQETAELAAGQLPAPVPVETREALVEAAFGRYVQGIAQSQILWRRPLYLYHMARPGTMAGDETVAQMAARVGSVVDEAVAACAGAAAIVVSHADPVKAFWNQYLGRAGWRMHMLPLAKGAFLKLHYEDATLVALKAHAPIAAGDTSVARET
jgi:broad specificity phosphatase PhoE